MNTLVAVLTANPGLMAMAGLLAMGALVFGVLGWALRGSRTARRGVIFVAVCFALVLLPQVLGHLAQAVRPPAEAAAATVTPSDGPVLAPDAAQHALYASRMPGLQATESASTGTGHQRLRLQFADAAAAAAGLRAYAQLHQVAADGGPGGAELSGPRGLGGGWVRLQIDGAALHIDIALDPAALAQGWPRQVLPAVAGLPAEPLLPALQPLRQAFQGSAMLQVAGVLLAVAVVVTWFFVGIAWAGSVVPPAGAAPWPAARLEPQLLALGQGSWPLQAERLADGRIAITWRHDDARWLDASGLHGHRRTDRLLLRLDERRHHVKVIEQWSDGALDAGPAGLRLRWRAGRGIRFFEREQVTVLGLQLDAQGRPTGAWQHTQRIDLQALKAPVIAAVSAAGWTWRPVLLDLRGGG